VGLIDEKKTEGRKSRATVPLNAVGRWSKITSEIRSAVHASLFFKASNFLRCLGGNGEFLLSLVFLENVLTKPLPKLQGASSPHLPVLCSVLCD
jgi:hypothetical protein